MARFWRAFFIGKVRLMANSMDFSLVLRAQTQQFRNEIAAAREEAENEEGTTDAEHV